MRYNIKSFSKVNKYTTYNFTSVKRFRIKLALLIIKEINVIDYMDMKMKTVVFIKVFIKFICVKGFKLAVLL